MTHKQAVITALDRLPESASLDTIGEELRRMAVLRHDRAELAAARTKTPQDPNMWIESFATPWALAE